MASQLPDAQIRWYLQRPSSDPAVAMVMLIVERVDDQRGYRCFVSSRQEARAELPHLRRLVESIGPREPARLYDPADADADA